MFMISVGHLLCSLYIFCTAPRGLSFCLRNNVFSVPRSFFNFPTLFVGECLSSFAFGASDPEKMPKKSVSGKNSEFIPILQKSLHFLCRLHNGFNCKKSFTNVYIAFASRFSALFFHILFRCCKVCITSDKKRN